MKRSLTRRNFVAGVSAAAAVPVIQSTARAAQFEMKYAHNLPVEHPLHVRTVEMWNAVRTQTGGRLNVTIFPNNQLGGDTAMLTQIRSGALQFFTVSGGILASVVPVAAIEQMPFSFKSDADAYRAMDGSLGAYIRSEIVAKDLVPFEKMFDLGFRQITSSTHPIRNADDLTGFKIRTPAGKIWIDTFRTLGANPTPINFSEAYTALQAKLVDGQETPYSIIEVSRFYEVQKYLSVTNHMWAGYWLLANPDAWKSLPPDIQQVVSRNAAKYALLQRQDVILLNSSIADKLRRQGLIFNTCDTASFRAKLGDFYASWKRDLGPTAWSLMEQVTGKLGA